MLFKLYLMQQFIIGEEAHYNFALTFFIIIILITAIILLLFFFKYFSWVNSNFLCILNLLITLFIIIPFVSLDYDIFVVNVAWKYPLWYMYNHSLCFNACYHHLKRKKIKSISLVSNLGYQIEPNVIIKHYWNIIPYEHELHISF